MDVLIARGLEKVYKGGTHALDGVSLIVERGTVFGLLGPNGAGKTTFVKIVATQLLPTLGTATVLGFDIVGDPRQVRLRIAAVPQEGRPLRLQTPYEHLLTYLMSRGVTLAEARRRSKETPTALNLNKYRDVICANLSGGHRAGDTLPSTIISHDTLRWLFLCRNESPPPHRRAGLSRASSSRPMP